MSIEEKRSEMIHALDYLLLGTGFVHTLEGGRPTFEHPTVWDARFSLEVDDTDQQVSIFKASGYRIRYDDDLFDALDAPSADTAEFLLLANSEGTDWREDLGLVMPGGETSYWLTVFGSIRNGGASVE